MADKKRVLITGGGGFVARHLEAELLEHGHDVALTVRPARNNTARTGRPDERVQCFELELPDRHRVMEICGSYQPQLIVHLAAMSNLSQSETRPEATLRANLDGTRSLFEGLAESDPDGTCGVIMVSTSHVYGAPHGRTAITEEHPLGPTSIYGRTKLAAELAAQCFTAMGKKHDVRPLIIYRCFNHTGPGQSDRFVLASFTRQLVAIEQHLQDPVLELGNLDVERDFTDVRDVARAYRLAVEGRMPAGIYNIASGKAITLRSVIDTLLRLSKQSPRLVSTDERQRSGEINYLCGEAKKLERTCGWKASIPIERTLGDLLEWWRRELTSEEVEHG